MILEVKDVWLLKCFWKRVFTCICHLYLEIKIHKTSYNFNTCSCPSVFSNVSTFPSGWDSEAREACSCSSQSSNTCNARWYSWWTSTSPLALLTAFCKTRSQALLSNVFFCHKAAMCPKHLIWLFALFAVFAVCLAAILSSISNVWLKYMKKNKWEMIKTLINF